MIAGSNRRRSHSASVYYRAKHIGLTQTDETMARDARSLAWSWGAIGLVTYALGHVLSFERIYEAQSSLPHLRFEDAKLFVLGGDDLLLVPIDPAGDHGDDDVEYR